MQRRLSGRKSMRGICLCLCVLVVGCFANTLSAGEMRYQINLSYVDGLDDLGDLVEENWEQEQLDAGASFADADVIVWPVGISFSPYYQWDSGLRVGAGIGPIVLIYGDVDHFELPVSARVGYALNPEGSVSPYVFAGPSYHIASGDYVDDSSIGVVVGGGVELIKSDSFVMGIEAAYDTAELDIDDVTRGRTQGMQTTEFSVGLFFLFK